MLEGRMRHRDSRGNHGLITGRGAQWMTAGRGIVHSEMPEQERGMLHGSQLWVNLPAREKMCPQYYQDLSPEQLGEASLSSAGSRVRVIAGHASGIAGPLRERPTDPSLMTLDLADDTPFELELPAGHTAFAFVYQGTLDIGAGGNVTTVPEGSLALLDAGNRLRFRATEQAAGVLVAAGRPLLEPIVQRGPFVMTTEEDIERVGSPKPIPWRRGPLGSPGPVIGRPRLNGGRAWCHVALAPACTGRHLEMQEPRFSPEKRVMVGEAGFEPATTSTQSSCTTGLCDSPG
jgi:redox-sensitive bicupin YhaK (pirin superfamily)